MRNFTFLLFLVVVLSGDRNYLSSAFGLGQGYIPVYNRLPGLERMNLRTKQSLRDSFVSESRGYSYLQMNGYVPDGLTRDEYESIKKNEREASIKKNFGAWGPRFRRSTAPVGDWMVNRSLWTGGFDSNNSKGNILGGRNPDIITVPKVTLRQLTTKYISTLIATSIIVESIFLLLSVSMAPGNITFKHTLQSYLGTWGYRSRRVIVNFIARIFIPFSTIHRFEDKISSICNSGGRLWTRRRCVSYLGIISIALDILGIFAIKIFFNR